MTKHIALLRGINVGKAKRISMPRLREVLAEAGFEDVATYVQSGNIVLSSSRSAQDVAAEIARVIEDEFGFEVPVVMRTHAQLREIVELNPLADIAEEPKYYNVTFFDRAPATDSAEGFEDVIVEGERVELHGSELYAYFGSGQARSKLAEAMARRKGNGAVPTSRNWRTVLALLELAADD